MSISCPRCGLIRAESEERCECGFAGGATASAEKPCHFCKALIPHDATVCKYCTKEQSLLGTWASLLWSLGVLVFILFVVIWPMIVRLVSSTAPK
jgi:RNA polymerase subunit RPABC4/transcription elongation factor Spt4